MRGILLIPVKDLSNAKQRLGARSDIDHLSRDLEAEDIGDPRRRRVKTPALEDVGPVHARCGDLDQDLSGTRPEHGALKQRQLLRSVGLRRHHRHHGVWDPRHRAGLLTCVSIGSTIR